MNVVEFLLKNGNLNGLGKLQAAGAAHIGRLCSFSYSESGVDQGKQIRDKAYLV